MTRFVGDAIPQRSGRTASTYTSKDLKKNMAKFLETGVHPDLERARRDASTSAGMVPLPDLDINRPFVFMDISIDNKQAGRLVIELFEELAPAAAKHLLTRCLPGATGSLAGAQIHKLLRNFVAYGGKSAAAGQGVQLHRTPRLRHLEAGAVSVSLDGTEFAIALAQALSMDATHQVVGRVHMGKEVLDQLSDTPTLPNDAPVPVIKITRCGATNSTGAHDSLEEALGKETPEQAAERLQQESLDTRSAVMEALQEGMSHKRKAPDDAGPSNAGASRSGAGAASGSQAAAKGAAPAARSVRSKMLDSLLDYLEDGNDEDSEG